MSRKVYVKPGELTVMGARIGALVAALFLVFGLAFGAVVLEDMPDSEGGLRVLTILFFAIWAFVCAAAVFFYLKVASGKGGDAANAVAELQFDESDDDDKPAPAPPAGKR